MTAVLEERDSATRVRHARDIELADAAVMRSGFASFGTCSIRASAHRPAHPRPPAPAQVVTTAPRVRPELPADTPFGLVHLPDACLRLPGSRDPAVGVRVGDQVLELMSARADLLPGHARLLTAGNLDALLAAGRPARRRAPRNAGSISTNR